MKKQSASYNGKAISYSTAGSGSPVMLVHGFGEDSSIWDKQVAELQKSNLLIIPDLPGTGQSELLTNHGAGLEDYAHALHAILEAEAILSVTVIGHSMGGYTALAFAELFPDKTDRLGLFHSSAFADDEDKISTRKKAIDFIRANGATAFLKTSIPGLFADAEKNQADINWLLDKGSSIKDETLVQYYQAMIARPDRTKILSNQQKPVLFILGTFDKAVPLEQGLKQTHLPQQSYIHILKNSGHMGMLEETGASNANLANFLQSA
ncbi:MAG: hypothetical protein JWQ27_877 [Ferruginibacter sp.]|nr:hypothetical protein [Ferruginibacter sp.]